MTEITSRWLDGLPLARIRQLSPDETAELRKRLRNLKWRGFVVLLTAPPVSFIVLALAIEGQAYGLPEPVAIVLSILALFGGMYVGGAYGLLRIRDDWRIARAVARDVAVGKIEVYEDLEPIQQEMEGSADAPMSLKENPDVFEVFPIADIIYRKNGEFQDGWPRALASTTAEFPIGAPEELLDLESLRDLPADSGRHRIRELTTDERAELSRFMSNMLRPSPTSRVALGFAVFQWICFIAALHREGVAALTNWRLQSAVLVLSTIFAVGILIWVLWIRRIIALDLARGEVMVTRLSEFAEGTPEEEAEMTIEWFPTSKRFWRIGKGPAQWRVLPNCPEEVAAPE